MTEFRTLDEVKDARAGLNALSEQFHSAIDHKLTEGGTCRICGRERHENFDQLQPCVAEMTRRHGEA